MADCSIIGGGGTAGAQVHSGNGFFDSRCEPPLAWPLASMAPVTIRDDDGGDGGVSAAVSACLAVVAVVTMCAAVVAVVAVVVVVVVATALISVQAVVAAATPPRRLKAG